MWADSGKVKASQMVVSARILGDDGKIKALWADGGELKPS